MERRPFRRAPALAAGGVVLSLLLAGGTGAFADPLEESVAENVVVDVPDNTLPEPVAAAPEPEPEPAADEPTAVESVTAEPAAARTGPVGPAGLERDGVHSTEGPPEPPPATFDVMRNDDVIELVRAEFGESVVVAAIEANASDFDVSPRVLVQLKRSGVPERVIEAMIAAERAQRYSVPPVAEPAAAPPPAVAAAPVPAKPVETAPSISAEAFQRLTQTVEELAARTNAPPPPAPAPPKPAVEEDAALARAPRAWLVEANGRTAFAPTKPQVAHTDLKRASSTAMKTLQGLAGSALTFVNPVLGSGLSGLFRGGDDPSMTAVWALPGTSSPRVLPLGAVFEMDFASIPGIDPADYRPAIVQLVPTDDNYRLVGAAKTSVENKGMPNGPIIEESVEAQLETLARGRFRVTLSPSMGAGEYALVLRPIVENERRGRRRRNSESSLGQLLGSAASEALYLTWDFAIRG